MQKLGTRGIRHGGFGAEGLIPQERNLCGPAGYPSDNAAVPDRFRPAVTKQSKDAQFGIILILLFYYNNPNL